MFGCVLWLLLMGFSECQTHNSYIDCSCVKTYINISKVYVLLSKPDYNKILYLLSPKSNGKVVRLREENENVDIRSLSKGELLDWAIEAGFYYSEIQIDDWPKYFLWSGQ